MSGLLKPQSRESWAIMGTVVPQGLRPGNSHILCFSGIICPCITDLHAQKGHVTSTGSHSFSFPDSQRTTPDWDGFGVIHSEQRRDPQLLWVVLESLRGYSPWRP